MSRTMGARFRYEPGRQRGACRRRHSSSATRRSLRCPRRSARHASAAAGCCSSPGRRGSARRRSCVPSVRGSVDEPGAHRRMRRALHPAPLGPLTDVAVAGGALADLVQLGAPPSDVYAALRDELAGHPTVLVLEDLHWADEATLDVLRLLGRRIETLPALVLATYRTTSSTGRTRCGFSSATWPPRPPPADSPSTRSRPPPLHGSHSDTTIDLNELYSRRAATLFSSSRHSRREERRCRLPFATPSWPVLPG